MTDFTKAFIATRKRLMDVVGKIVPASDVEDIVQDTFIKTHSVKNSDEIQKPEAYMVQIAKNLAYDYVKSARVKNKQDTGDDFSSFVDHLSQDEFHDTTFNAAASEKTFAKFYESSKELPEKCREVYLLKKVYGYSQKEIASKLGIAESTVEKHIAYGTKRMFQTMKNDMALSLSSNNKPSKAEAGS